MERWSSEDVRRLLHNKYVVIVGDSIQRGLYKDLVRLLQTDEYTDKFTLKAKGEKTCHGDTLIEGGMFGKMHNGKSYREVRQYHTDTHLVTFYMVTSCYSGYVETILDDFCMDPQPDIVCMSSCVWDITRNGPKSRQRYQENLQRLAQRLLQVLPEDALFVWNTATPVSSDVKGGFLPQEISFMNQVLRHDVLESNYYAAQVMIDYGFDVLDLHYHFRKWLMLRERDGIHWNSEGTRRMSNLVLDHVATCLDFPLPRSLWDEVAHCLSDGLTSVDDLTPVDCDGQVASPDDQSLPDSGDSDIVDRGLGDEMALGTDSWSPDNSPEDSPLLNALSALVEFSENFTPFPDEQFEGPTRNSVRVNGQWSHADEGRYQPY